MDNNNTSNYNQSFTQGVKAEARQTRMESEAHRRTMRYMIGFVIFFAAVSLVEGILLIVLTINNSSNGDDAKSPVSSNDSGRGISGDGLFFDDDHNIVAFNYVCTDESGAKYVFNKDRTYQQIDNESSVVDNGVYGIIKSGAVMLGSARTSFGERIVYYDGYDIIDGITFYTCSENKENE